MRGVPAQPRTDWHDVVFTSGPEAHGDGSPHIMTA